MKKIKNLKRKIIVLAIVLFILLFVLVFKLFITNNKPNKLSARVITPVNNAFTDNQFYSCVVNSYNKENDTNYGYDYNLSDEQLASIKDVNCNEINNYFYKGDIFEDGVEYYSGFRLDRNSKVETWLGIPESYSDNFGDIDSLADMFTKSSYKVNNIKGIEKLTGLKNFDILESYVDISDEFIFKNNINLETLKISTSLNSGGKTINLSNNKKLKTLYFNSYSGYKKETIIYPEQFKNQNLKNEDDITLILESNLNSDINNLNGVNKLAILGEIKDYSYIKDLSNLKNLVIYNKKNITSDVTLSDFKSIDNLQTLYFHGESSDLGPDGTLPKMDKLKKLYLDVSDNFANFNFENVNNVESVSLKDYNSKTTKIMDLNGFSSLSKLKFLNVEDSSLTDLTGIETLSNLETLVVDNIDLNNKVYSIKNLKGIVNDFANLPNLKAWYAKGYIGEEPKKKFSEEEINIIKNLNYIVCPFFKYIISEIKDGEFKNLEYLYVDNISQTNLNKLVNLKELEVLNSDILNVENNKKLKKVFGYTTGFSNLTDLEILFGAILSDEKGIYYMKKNDLYFFEEKDYEKLVPSNTLKLTKLRILVDMSLSSGFSVTSNLDFSNNTNLELIHIGNAYNGKETGIDVSKCVNLRYLYYEGNLRRLNISNNKKLAFVNNIFPNQNIVLKDKVDIRALYDVPEQIKFLDFASDDARLDGNIMTLNKLGLVNFSVNFINTSAFCINNDSIQTNKETTLKGDLLYLKVSSDKLDINSDKMYIYTNGINKEKDIIKNTHLSTYALENKDGFSKIYMYVNKNNLIAKSEGKEILKYELIKVLSSKYEVKENEIRYLGDFDISNVRIINANYEVKDDVLKIVKENEVIKEYKLVKEDEMVGDVNKDGIISISDLTKQYKHVKYVLDLEGKDFYRADMNADDDISITDVSLLYKLLKEKVSD